MSAQCPLCLKADIAGRFMSSLQMQVSRDDEEIAREKRTLLGGASTAGTAVAEEGYTA
jgi:hypothetical protein